MAVLRRRWASLLVSILSKNRGILVLVIERGEEDRIGVEVITAIFFRVVVAAVVVVIIFLLLQLLFVPSFLFFPLDPGIEPNLTKVGFVVGPLDISAIDEAGQQTLDIAFIVVYRCELEQLGEEGAGQGQGVAEILEKVGKVG